MTIHFVYTVPNPNSLTARVAARIIRDSHVFSPLYRHANDKHIPWKSPIRAPHSISYNLLHALKEKAPVRFYSMYERGPITMGPDDIFIGQPLPQGGFSYSGRPSTDDHESITSATLRKYAGSPHLKCLIMPFANDSLLVSWAHELARDYCDALLLIGGNIWTRNWQNTPFSDIDQAKVTRLDMGISMKDYPQEKTAFNEPGKRRYLYIGHTAWYKNTKELERIAAALPHFKGSHIGNGRVEGFDHLADFADLTPEFVRELAREHDIFINTSTADAQATTILEAMCFGFVVAATPESGYDIPSLISLSTDNTDANIRALTTLQSAPSKELELMVEENRATVAAKHSWNQFTTTALSSLSL